MTTEGPGVACGGSEARGSQLQVQLYVNQRTATLNEAILASEGFADSQPDGRHICAECREPVKVDWPTCPNCGSTKAFELIG